MGSESLGNPRLWQPTDQQIANTNLKDFENYLVEQNLSAHFKDYFQLHHWSVQQSDLFWSALWDYCQVNAKQKGQTIVDKAAHIKDWRWFPQAQLNYAENLLTTNTPQEAIVSYLENGQRRSLNYQQLQAQSNSLAQALIKSGVQVGDRVAGFLPNIIETVIAMLACSRIGAIWTSCSPDFGAQGALDRFRQTQPKILFATPYYFYNGKQISTEDKVRKITAEIKSLEKVVLVPLEPHLQQPNSFSSENSIYCEYDNFLSTDNEQIPFAPLPFNHPLYILYSSGTTGLPKCIIHGAGGSLLQHLKEQQLHVNLKPGDCLFFFTTCGWMMWNWLVSALASQIKIVLYDGSPFFPTPDRLIQLIELEGINVFGAGAKYFSSLEKQGIKPNQSFGLDTLNSILSTGSPLSHESFDYIYQHFKQDLNLASISGGTDILSCFVLGTPTLAVHKGEIQCPGLAMDVKIYNESGQTIENEKGELVCRNSFPSMPIGFWQDPKQEKYRNAYFSRFENIWAHGDYAETTRHGGYIIHGRADAVLNPGGVRIGTAEIYRQVEKIDCIEDSIVVGQNWKNDTRVVLFVKLKPKQALDNELIQRIKQTIRSHTTPRHVPQKILQVEDIPRTISGKLVELAVRNVIHNEAVKNKDALANPDALKYFQNRIELTEE